MKINNKVRFFFSFFFIGFFLLLLWWTQGLFVPPKKTTTIKLFLQRGIHTKHSSYTWQIPTRWASFWISKGPICKAQSKFFASSCLVILDLPIHPCMSEMFLQMKGSYLIVEYVQWHSRGSTFCCSLFYMIKHGSQTFPLHLRHYFYQCFNC